MTKYPYSDALADMLEAELGGTAIVLPGGDVQADTPDGTLTIYADGTATVRELGVPGVYGGRLRDALAQWGVRV